MTASYNNGSNFLYHAGLPSSTPATGTLPSGIAVGDVMIVSVEAFTYTGGSPAFSTPTSGGSGTWEQIGSIGTSSQGSLVNYTTVWMKVATSGDAGSTFSIQFTGTNGSTNAYYWTGTVDFYTGFYTSSPIGAVGQTNAINASSVTTPTIVTQQANSWVLQIVEAAVLSSGNITAGPSTNRRLYNPGDGVGVGVSDSNGSVGAAGTSAGGGSFTLSATSNGGASAFTIELTTQGGDAGTASVALKKMTVSGSGGPILPTGTASVTLKKMTVSGSGLILPTGTAVVTLKKMVVLASGASTVILDTSVRLQLQELLEGLDAEFHVYFQPPPNIQMVYPAVVYNRDNLSSQFADNLPYSRKFRWQITVIDADPDSIMNGKLADLPLTRYVRHYVTAGLNHDIYQLYF